LLQRQQVQVNVMAPILTPIMILILSFLGFVLLLVISILSYKLHKKITKRRKPCSASDYAAGSARTTLTEFPNDLIIRAETHCNIDNFSLKNCSSIPESSVQFEHVIGEGYFGIVYMAYYNGHRTAAKKIKTDFNLNRQFVKEAKTVAQIENHSNLVNLIGIVFCEKEAPKWLIMEYCEHGNLNDYLRLMSETEEDKILEFSSFVYQITSGLDHLHRHKCLHRDLATRNILLASNMKVKIGDFGLSRFGDYYIQNRNSALPLRWMAIESIRDRIFTSKTDIWSLGVVIWEIFTFGATPYETLSNDKILDYLLEGGRLENSHSIPKIFWNMVKLCWLEESNDRPNSTYIKDISRQIYTEIEGFYSSGSKSPTTPDSEWSEDRWRIIDDLE